MQAAAKITGFPFSEDVLDYLAKDISTKFNDIYIANKVVVVLPSRRAVRNLKSKLLSLSHDKICFLPQIITFSDIPNNLILFNSVCDNLDMRLPEVIDSFSLDMIVLEIIEEIKSLYPNFTTFRDKKISTYIKKFFIKFFTYNQYSSSIKIDNPDYEIFTYLLNTFNEKLKSLGKVTEQQLRNEAILRLKNTWNTKKAGSYIYSVLPTSNTPYIFDFLKLVAARKNAEIIIGGLEHPIDLIEWESTTEKHANFFIKRFLNHIGLNVDKVNCLPMSQVVNNDYRIIEAKNEIEEGRQIALAIVDHLNSDIHNIGIVTENRIVAKLIKENLKRYSLDINDTVARSLIELNEIKFFLLIFELATVNSLNKVALLSFFNHPLTGLNTKEVEDFEINYFRTPKIYNSLFEVLNQIESNEQYLGITQAIKAVLEFKPKILSGKNFYSFFSEHLRYFNALVSEEIRNSLPSLDYLTDLKMELKPLTYARKPIKIRLYKELLIKILGEQSYRDEEFIEEVQILTPLEARLQSFDLVIIPSLNEGNFPNITRDWPLIDAALAAQFNFPNYQEPLGFGAHDFNSLISNKRVILSRSLYSQSKETTESRFLSQLKVAASIEQVNYKSAKDSEIFKYNPSPRANPKPPLSARPKKFSVSSVERLIYNPYVYYAKYILNLTPLDELGATSIKKDFGIYFHKALAEIFEQTLPLSREEFTEDLLSKFKTCTETSVLNDSNTLQFWLKRVERIAPWLYDYEKEVLPNLKGSLNEKRKEVNLNIANTIISISAIFDRVMLYKDGGIKIIDYKTGYTPLQKEVDKGLSPQFPIENLILREVMNTDDISQEYIELRGKKDIANSKPITVDSKVSRTELIKLITMFLDSNQGYFASIDLEKNQRFKEYQHLISLNPE
ncbi:PD-(D/E)XK nuclease family protein [Holosporaceae bacterium 'Namur']|nr:PD-(D/E)XK nuclease family protein [Holosporaceae bacterium 'Namur']